MNPIDVFGKINPSEAPGGGTLGFLKLPQGAAGLSQFLSSLVNLLFMIAALVFVFMVIWGAFEWISSGGDKEKVGAAQKRIVSALIGLVLFALAFAIIRTVGLFTGFGKFIGT